MTWLEIRNLKRTSTCFYATLMTARTRLTSTVSHLSPRARTDLSPTLADVLFQCHSGVIVTRRVVIISKTFVAVQTRFRPISV